jgi:hypothetical protein
VVRARNSKKEFGKGIWKKSGRATFVALPGTTKRGEMKNTF